MPSRQDIVVKARECLKTPYHHQGRLREAGLDCVGLIIYVAKAFSLPHHDLSVYDRYPDGVTLMSELSRAMDSIPVADAGVGDVLVFWITKPTKPQHLAIKTEVGIIHTHSGVGWVVEHTLDERWCKRIHAAFRFRGVEWQP